MSEMSDDQYESSDDLASITTIVGSGSNSDAETDHSSDSDYDCDVDSDSDEDVGSSSRNISSMGKPVMSSSPPPSSPLPVMRESVVDSRFSLPVCVVKGCSVKARFGPVGKKIPVCCSKHGESFGMVNVLNKACLHDGCSAYPVYGNRGSRTALFCKEHRPSRGTVNVRNRQCVYEGCCISASYGMSSDRTAMYCATHGRAIGAISVMTPRCSVVGCGMRVPRKKSGNDYPSYCKTHARVEKRRELPKKRNRNETETPSIHQNSTPIHRSIVPFPPINTTIPPPIPPPSMRPSPSTIASTPDLPSLPDPSVPLPPPIADKTPPPSSSPIDIEAVDDADDGVNDDDDHDQMRKGPSHKRRRKTNENDPATYVRRSICHMDHCTEAATHGMEWFEKTLYCAKHGEPLGFIDKSACGGENHKDDRRSVTALVSEPVARPPIRDEYGLSSMFGDIELSQCVAEGCTRWPYYGERGTTYPMYCSLHSVGTGLVRVKRNRECVVANCAKQAHYGPTDSLLPMCCGTHGGAVGMVHVYRTGRKRPRKTPPSLAMATTPMATTTTNRDVGERVETNDAVTSERENCTQDAEPTQVCLADSAKSTRQPKVVVGRNKCVRGNCNKIANHAVRGTNLALFCPNHANKDIFVEVNPGQCVVGGCSKQASYGNRGTSRLLYCPEHGKIVGMVDLASEQTENQEQFELADHDSDPTTESSAKDDSCTPVDATPADVGEKEVIPDQELEPRKYQQCIFKGCDTYASYGCEGSKTPLFCQTHKTGVEIVYVRPRRLCGEADCSTRACYGVKKGDPPLYCATHGRKRGMINTVSPRCSQNGCERIALSNTREGYATGFCMTHGRLAEEL